MDPVPSREIADMNGARGAAEKNGELVFDEAWQGRIFGMTVAMSHDASFAVARVPGAAHRRDRARRARGRVLELLRALARTRSSSLLADKGLARSTVLARGARA